MTRPKGVQPQGFEEMVRVVASFEHLDAAHKTQFGHWLADTLRNRGPSGGPWVWALGRLGARAPIYGSIHRTVAPELAGEWVQLLLEKNLAEVDGTPFAAATLARLTGDRTRDLDEALRTRVVDALRATHAPESWVQMVTEVVTLKADDEARSLGDTLPVGLQLR